MAKSLPKPIEKLSYEAAFSELESIVASLESGDRSLDESMKIFQRGQALLKHCATLLDEAELKIKEVSGESSMDLSGTE